MLHDADQAIGHVVNTLRRDTGPEHFDRNRRVGVGIVSAKNRARRANTYLMQHGIAAKLGRRNVEQ